MQLESARFNRFLAKIGQRVSWRASSACPCRDRYSGSADPDCQHCSGTGRLWAAAVPSTLGIVSREIVRQYAMMGQLDLGDVMLVIPSDQPAYAMGEFDRVTLTDRTEPFSQTLIRGVTDRLPLRFEPASIDQVTWLDSEQALQTAAVPTSSAGGLLTWDESGPPLNATYAVTGRRHPEFFCYLTLPLDRPHHGGEPLPRRVILRRFDLFSA